MLTSGKRKQPLASFWEVSAVYFHAWTFSPGLLAVHERAEVASRAAGRTLAAQSLRPRSHGVNGTQGGRADGAERLNLSDPAVIPAGRCKWIAHLPERLKGCSGSAGLAPFDWDRRKARFLEDNVELMPLDRDAFSR
jgi:hypothetical protein